jgi:putative ABC transport system substrate-binding protein
MNRRQVLGLAGILLILPLTAAAQQMPVIGFLSSRSSGDSAPFVAAFRDGLQQVGFREAENVLIEFHWADNHYDRLPGMAAEFVRRPVAVIVAAGGTPSAFAARNASSTIPVVFTSAGNAVEIGLVASLGRPGGNLTGTDATLTTELDAKRLQLLRELLQGNRPVAALVNSNRPHLDSQIGQIESAGRALGMQLAILKVGSDGELDTAFADLAGRQVGGLIIGGDPLFISLRERLIELAAKHRIATIYGWRDFVVSGGLISYGANLSDAYRQAGVYAGRILKGEKPADLPVIQPTRFELVLNLKTARALGLTIPPAILARTDEVIE